MSAEGEKKKKLKRLISPPAELSQHGTGLQFTDILFGFVISQLFLRLQHWSHLSDFSRHQLICSTVLVLGSWIGFRRSLNRTDYELKFFNVPLWRFVLDQMMVVFYFRIATLTPLDPKKEFNFADVTHQTVKVLCIIFMLYLAWDLLGQWMAADRVKKYKGTKDLVRPLITLGGLAAFLLLLLWVDSADNFEPTTYMTVAIGVLILYRWAKEMRSGWKWTDPEPTPPARAGKAA